MSSLTVKNERQEGLRFLFCGIMILLAFWQAAAKRLWAQSGTAVILLAVLAPLVCLYLPVALYPVFNAKKQKYFPRLAAVYGVNKTEGKSVLLAVCIGVFGWLAAVYLYEGIICLYQYFSNSLILSVGATTEKWWLTALMGLCYGALPAAATELFYRGNACFKGQSTAELLLAFIMPITLCFELNAIGINVIVGVLSVAALIKTRSVIPSVVIASSFRLLNIFPGSMLIPPFSFRLATGIETSLVFGLRALAIGAAAIGATVICFMLMKKGEAEGAGNKERSDFFWHAVLIAFYLVLWAVLTAL